MTLTMIDGEPVVLIWRAADFEEALEAAGDMGLPVAASWSVAEGLGFHRDDEYAAERADQAPDPE